MLYKVYIFVDKIAFWIP